MMNPADALGVMAAVAVAGTGLAYVVGLVTASPCTCGQCAFHSNERRVKAEADRARRHREVHEHWGVPWEDKRCAQCRLGHSDDREVH